MIPCAGEFRRVVRRVAAVPPALLAVLAVLLLHPAAGWAQKVDLNQFEEYKPKIQEIGPNSDQQTPPNAAAPSAVPPAAPVPQLPSVTLKPAPPAAAPPGPQPILPPPVASPRSEDAAKTQVQMRVNLPTKGVSLDSDFQQQIRTLNDQIAVLKERVIEAKSRLLSYSQKVAQGFASGTQLFMKAGNKLGDDFEIEKLVFYLDGHQVFSREFEKGEKVDEILAYKGSVLPGRHRIDVDAILRGDDGIFDFGYSARLKLESGEYFAANEGKIVELGLILFDRGGTFKAIENRPALKFDIVERDVF